MTPVSILAFDLGTTHFKAAAFTGTGQLLALSRVAAPIDHGLPPRAGQWEMTSTALLSTIHHLVHDLSTRLAGAGGLRNVLAISIASQANSFFLLDAHHNPVGPAVLWPDDRARHISPLHALTTREICGIPELDHEFAPSKMRLAMNTPGDKARSFCFLADHLAHALCGTLACELSVAALSSLVDVRQTTWWNDAFAAHELSALARPPMVRPATVLGPVTALIRDEWNLPNDCVVVAGALDQYATLLGAGAAVPGILAESTGTALAAIAFTHNFSPNLPHAFQGPLWSTPNGTPPWARITFSDTSASLLSTYRDLHTPHLSYDALDLLANHSTRAAHLPRVASLADRQAAFARLPPNTPPGEVVRGIYTLVAAELATLIDKLHLDINEIRSCGGGARSKLWLAIKAARLGVPLRVPLCSEATLMGASILGGAGLGLGTVESLASQWVHVGDPIPPIPREHPYVRP